MASARPRLVLLLLLAATSACASATDRLNEGMRLQSQGRYIEAVYRYAEAIEKDRELAEPRDRILAAGDTAVMLAMDEADELERRGDPVSAAGRYRQIDQMLARIREVGLRPLLPGDYMAIRRAIFDNAIRWQMRQGDDAAMEGRWQDARRFFQGARSDFLPSRDQVEASWDAETALLLRWAEVSLEDGAPRAAYDLAQAALEVRGSPSRETVLTVRDIQERALAAGTVVLAVVPVTAEPGVREWLGGEFEIQLDSDLALDHWTRPPLFVDIADPIILRRELRGLLRGQATQSPLIVGRALELIGADLGVMVRLSGIEVTEDDVDRDRHEAVVRRNQRRGIVAEGARPADTVGAQGRENPGRGRGPVEEPPGRDGDPGGGRGPVEEPPGRDGNPGGGRGPGGQPGDSAQAGDPADPSRPPQLDPRQPAMDTVVYETVRGTMQYFVEAEIVLVDTSGREVSRFMAASTQSGPFERGEFAGDPRILPLEGDRVRFFDPAVLAEQMAAIEGAVLEELAVAIAAGTYEQVLSAIR